MHSSRRQRARVRALRTLSAQSEQNLLLWAGSVRKAHYTRDPVCSTPWHGAGCFHLPRRVVKTRSPRVGPLDSWITRRPRVCPRDGVALSRRRRDFPTGAVRRAQARPPPPRRVVKTRSPRVGPLDSWITRRPRVCPRDGFTHSGDGDANFPTGAMRRAQVRFKPRSRTCCERAQRVRVERSHQRPGAGTSWVGWKPRAVCESG